MIRVLVVDDQPGWRTHNANAVLGIFGDGIVLDTASDAKEGYGKLLESKENPYDYLLTDMQMESDYAPKMAGEWLIEQAQALPFCFRTKIIIISAAPRIRLIAENYGVDYIPKSIAAVSLDAYRELIHS